MLCVIAEGSAGGRRASEPILERAPVVHGQRYAVNMILGLNGIFSVEFLTRAFSGLLIVPPYHRPANMLPRLHMIKALIALAILGSGAALCFWRAHKIQSRHARPDGSIKAPAYSPMYLWVLAGGMFVLLAIVVPFAAIEPGFVFGRR